MTVVAWIAGSILGVAAALALTRLVRGPTVLDRVIALDVLLSTIIGAIAVEAAVNRHGTSLPVLAVIALLGFIGSVAVSRFVSGETDSSERPLDPDEQEASP